MDLHRAGNRHLGFTFLVAGIFASSASNPLTVNGLSAHSTDSGLFKVLFLKTVRTRGKSFWLEKAGVKSRDIPLQPQAALRLSVPNCLREQSPLGRGGDRAAPPPPA